jgi:hypothetical protein
MKKNVLNVDAHEDLLSKKKNIDQWMMIKYFPGKKLNL